MFSLIRAGHLEPLRRAFILSPPLCRLHSTIFEKSVSRHHKKLRLAEGKHIQTLLSFLLLPHSGRAHGLPVRDDGSLSVRALLRHPQFTSMNFLQLEEFVLSDLKHRFELSYHPKRPEDPWWVRAKGWKEKNLVLRPIVATDNFNLPVIYSTTLAAWEDHISAKGIPSGRGGYIHLTLGLPATNLLAPHPSTSPSSSPLVHVHIHPINALKLSNMQFFLVGPRPQDPQSIRTIWTKGDENGFIPPQYFGKVDVVRVQKRLLAGTWEESTSTSSKEGEEDDTSCKTNTDSVYPIQDPHLEPSTGLRRTFVKLPDQNVRGFADLVSSVGGWQYPITDQGVALQQQEARELVLEGA